VRELVLVLGGVDAVVVVVDKVEPGVSQGGGEKLSVKVGRRDCSADDERQRLLTLSDSPRHSLQLELRVGRVARGHTLEVGREVRLAVDGLAGLGQCRELLKVALLLLLVLGEAEETDWG
jgi:hypothetical protein